MEKEHDELFHHLAQYFQGPNSKTAHLEGRAHSERRYQQTAEDKGATEISTQKGPGAYWCDH